MNLGDGLYAVRAKIQELDPNYWSDQELIDDLNVSARRMCSAGQYLEAFGTFETQQLQDGQWAQEYVLPLDVDQITGASYLSGVVFPLTPVTRASVQLGGLVAGIPFYFYVRKVTKTLTSQTANGIESMPLSPLSANDARTVIGLYPIPQQVLPVYIWYQQWHPDLKNESDEVQIPDRFKQAWISYAVARAKEKEENPDMAVYYDGIHEKGMQDFIEWCIDNGQQITPPIFSNRPIPPYFLRGANTVIVVAQNPGTTNL